MKNKRYRELAAILVMMTMTAGSITTVAAETETTAEEETTAETETDEPREGKAGSRGLLGVGRQSESHP